MNNLTMNSLPYEVIRAIQEHLPPYEKVVIAPQISKDWYDVISPKDHQEQKNKLYVEIFVKNKFETIFPFHARGAFHCEFTSDLRRKLFNAIINNDDSKFIETEIQFEKSIHSNSFDVIFDSPEINPHYEYVYKTICKIQKFFSERTSNIHPYTRQILEFYTLFVKVSQIDCLLSYEVCIAGHVLDFHLRKRIQCVYEQNVKTLSFIDSINTLPVQLYYDHEGKITLTPNEFDLNINIEDEYITNRQQWGFGGNCFRESVQIKKKSLIVWKSNEISNETIANIPSCKMSQFIRWCILFKTIEKIAGVVNTSVKIA